MSNNKYILRTCDLSGAGDYPKGVALVSERTWTSEVQEGNPRQAVLALMPTIGVDVAVWVTDEDDNWLWGCYCPSQSQGHVEEFEKRPAVLRHRAVVKPDDVRISRAEFKRRLASASSVDRLWFDGDMRRAIVEAVRSADVVFQKVAPGPERRDDRRSYLRFNKGDVYYATADGKHLKLIVPCVEAAEKCTCRTPCTPIALEYRLNH